MQMNTRKAVGVITPSINKNKSNNSSYRKKYTGLFFVLPSVLFIGVFFILPLILTGWMSLHDWPLLGASKFIGLDNYAAITSDNRFWDSLLFTVKYTLLVTPVIFILAFILALLVNRPAPGIGIYRTIYFLPVVVGLGTASLLWVWMLNDRVGVFDQILVQLGIIRDPIIWLADPNIALGVTVLMVVWKTVGLTMLLLLIGIQGIPEELNQAAMVDGASYLARFVRITLPLLRRTLALALILSVIGSFLAFDQFYIMTRGGPQNQTITIVYWIYNNAFTYFKLGYGAALSIVLLLILVVLSIVQLLILRDNTEY